MLSSTASQPLKLLSVSQIQRSLTEDEKICLLAKLIAMGFDGKGRINRKEIEEANTTETSIRWLRLGLHLTTNKHS